MTDDNRQHRVDSPSDSFQSEMAKANVAPLWDKYDAIATPEPRPPDPGTQWRWDDLLPLIERSASEVSTDEAERRVLLLESPYVEANATSTTGLLAAVQVLMPGESARPHRHSAAALRFVLEGHGAQTVVNEKLCPMEEGDLILTPAWTWHGHENPGTGRVSWLDVLDVPITRFYDAFFFEPGPPHDLPSDESMLDDVSFARGGLVPLTGRASAGYSPRFRYPWSEVKALLEQLAPEDDGSKTIRYTDPARGGPVLPTMDCYVRELAADAQTRPYRTTNNAVCVVVEGTGVSRVGNEEISWSRNDIITLPHWTWISHRAAGENARLFMSTDRGLLESLGLLREERAAS